MDAVLPFVGMQYCSSLEHAVDEFYDILSRPNSPSEESKKKEIGVNIQGCALPFVSSSIYQRQIIIEYGWLYCLSPMSYSSC